MLGDVLEWVAGAALVAAAYDWRHSMALTLLAAFGALFYLAQVHSKTALPRLLRRKRTPNR